MPFTTISTPDIALVLQSAGGVISNIEAPEIMNTRPVACNVYKTFSRYFLSTNPVAERLNHFLIAALDPRSSRTALKKV